MKKQAHVFYSGRVQGVGFRFTAEDIAGDLGINGWVKNLRDGRVEIVAEAEEGLILQFMTRLNQYFSNYIRDQDIQWQEAKGELQDFKVRF